MPSPFGWKARGAFHHVPIAVQLVVAFTLALTGASLLVAFSVVSEFHTTRSASITQLAGDATAQSTGIATSVASVTGTLQPFTKESGIASLRPGRCQPQLDALGRLIPAGRLVVLAGGRPVCRSGGWTTVQPAGWLGTALRSGFASSGPVYAGGSGTVDLGYAVAFTGAQGQRAVLAVLQPAHGSLLNEGPPGTNLLVVDARSGVVLDSVGAAVPARLSAPLTRQLRTRQSVTTSSLGSGTRIYARAAIAGTGWVVLAGMPQSRALAPAARDLRRNLVVGVLLMLVFVALGWVLIRQLAGPLRRLRRQVDALAADGPPGAGGRAQTLTLPKRGPSELVELGQALNTMVQARAAVEARLASIVRHSSDLILIVAADGTIRYATPSADLLAGRDAAELPGTPLLDLVHPDDRAAVAERFAAWCHGSPESSGRAEFRLCGSERPRDVEARVQNLLDDPAVHGLVVTCHDITDRKATEAELAHAATHDTMTGLPNRVLVLDRLAQILARSARTGHGCAVMFIDLDRFKLVNDTGGHAAGDALLIAVTRRLAGVLRPLDTFGRFGGDEFVVLCEDVADADLARQIADRLLAEMALPFLVGGQEIFVTMSIGIALGQPGDEPAVLLRDADAALYRAKDNGRASVAVFDGGIRETMQRRLDIGSGLQRAIENETLFLEFQPILSFATGGITGVEALLRWWPDGQLVPPDVFIPVAEETGAIGPIGEWVLRQACTQVARWAEHPGLPDGFRVSVNVSARQLAAGGFVDAVRSALATTGVSPAQLVLEVTESVFLHEGVNAVRVLGDLRELGVATSIDDFGVGYSSLGYLERLPVDQLKIDRSFVSRLDGSERAHAIVNSVVRLAHAVGLQVVAEGVETADQCATLLVMGCDNAQGYLFARPTSPAGITALLAEQPHRVQLLAKMQPAY